jgi:predicted PurR-regulated permease PerM
MISVIAMLFGSKLGVTVVSKDLIGIKSKIVTVLVTGSVTSITDQMGNSSSSSSSSSSISDFFINSPLESTTSEILNQTLKAHLTMILSDNLFVNLSTVYLLCVLALVLTIRFVVDHEFILNKVKSLNSPFGKVLHYILSKLFSV